MNASVLSYAARAQHCRAPLAQQLLSLMDEKKTNLALSADVTSAKQLISLADQLGPAICVLKTHIDMIEDFSPRLTQTLRELARKHQFLLFEDRKFADIGETVKHQYGGGIYQIAQWADLTNAHSLPGPGIIQGLTSAMSSPRGLILIAEMSSQGHLMPPDYMRQTLALAEKYPEHVIGFITQHALSADAHWINFTPGVKRATNSDGLGQQYVTPAKAILDNGSDVIIVGRGILHASDPMQEAHYYREEAWRCYQKRITIPRN